MKVNGSGPPPLYIGKKKNSTNDIRGGEKGFNINTTAEALMPINSATSESRNQILTS